MTHLSEDIATRVRLGRGELGMTQSDLAEKAGVSRATVARIEAGGSDSVAFGAMIRVLEASNWSIYIDKGVTVLSGPAGFDVDAYFDSLFGEEGR